MKPLMHINKDKFTYTHCLRIVWFMNLLGLICSRFSLIVNTLHKVYINIKISILLVKVVCITPRNNTKICYVYKLY